MPRLAAGPLQIRFFERVKLERRLHRLQAQLAATEQAAGGAGGDGDADGAAAGGAAGGASAEQLRQQIVAVKEDLEYVLHFPKAEKYVSLLRQADNPEAQVGRSSHVGALQACNRGVLWAACRQQLNVAL